MDTSQSLRMETRLGLRLSQQQLRFVKLLEMTAPELDEAVERELEDNPALDAVDGTEVSDFADVSTTSMSEPRVMIYSDHSADNDSSAFDDDRVAREPEENLYEHLYGQLGERNLDENVRRAAEYIIGSLDTNGYLRRSLRQVSDDMAFGPGIFVTDSDLERALEEVRSMEPYGVGARDLRECLELQLQHLPSSQTRDDALRIVRDNFEAFSMKHKSRLISSLHIAPERIDAAIDLIVSLNPKPGASFGAVREGNAIIPDIMVTPEDNDIRIVLNNRIPELRIDEGFRQAYDDMRRTAAQRKDARQRGVKRKGDEFVAARFNDAREFIKILSQRQQTLLSVMTAIVNHQKEYFLTQDVFALQPMMIKDIAASTGLDMSVISRATTNKHVATPWGIFPLRFFFSDSIGDENASGQSLTNRKMEAHIEEIVNGEDKRHPLSDEQIKERMLQQGFDVSRRTVAKYRDRKGIPVARLRKEM